MRVEMRAGVAVEVWVVATRDAHRVLTCIVGRSDPQPHHHRNRQDIHVVFAADELARRLVRLAPTLWSRWIGVVGVLVLLVCVLWG